jgi:hypothetical protein
MAGQNPQIRARDELGRNQPVLKDLDPSEVLSRYLADERSADIAASYGVTRSALNQWLLKTCEDEWKEAQVARAITRKEAAEDALEQAPDPLALAKARELLKSAQWELERVCRRIYGEERNIGQVTVNPVLIISVAEQKPASKPASTPMSLPRVNVQPQQSTAASLDNIEHDPTSH